MSTSEQISEFKKRFPEFADSDTVLIGYAIDEALIFMNGWSSGAAGVTNLAMMYLTAHIMAMNQFASDNDGQYLESETIGRISLRYRSIAADTFIGDLVQTPYGKRYKALTNIENPSFKSVRVTRSTPKSIWGWWP